MTERANAMESIEQTIVDLGSIYQQLATLIKEQDEVIQRFV
jgi:syntaxin 5